MLEKGKKVGEYVLLEKLGAGGFGDVWKAEKRTVLDVNHFALKFFRPKEDGVDFDKIGKELAVWKQLRGLPHIISVIELDRFEDYVYVVSDFADGGSLEKYLNKNGKAQTETEAVQIALEILTGLENLHGKGFVHRDLKPDNILIMNGRFCLADFGISREIKTHSKATGTAGTMEYMPPEAFEKTPSITQQTDIWAVGAILQRLLTGKLPYPQDEQPSLIAAILMSEPDEMPEIVSESLRSIVKKSLQKNREDRFQSASEMREVLQNSQKFLESQTFSQAETIELEDFVETAKFEIKSNKAWREIEGKNKRHRKLEVERRPKEAQEARRLQEIEAKRRQNELVETQQKLKFQPPDQSSNLLKWIIGGVSGFVVFIFGIIGINSLFNNNNSTIGNNVNKPANTSIIASNPSIFKNSIRMEFVKISSGSFMMGGDKSDDEKPVHKVTISNDFYMGKYEVTQAQWKAVMNGNPSNFKGDNLPIENVSWDDALEFIKKLNAKGEGTYRLPTEAEWEYAARAGTTDDYAGNLDAMAWYEENSGSKTHEVGTKQANAWGLYDMHGNVWEWCEDWYGAYSSSARTDPTGEPNGLTRVLRGGAWTTGVMSLRSAFRGVNSPSHRNANLGFRVVRY